MQQFKCDMKDKSQVLLVILSLVAYIDNFKFQLVVSDNEDAIYFTYQS